MKFYICGPTNQELKISQQNFDHWEEKLKELELEVINPMSFDANLAWGDFKQQRLDAVRECDGVFMLSGWQNSKISQEEFVLAVDLKKLMYMDYQFRGLQNRIESLIQQKRAVTS